MTDLPAEFDETVDLRATPTLPPPPPETPVSQAIEVVLRDGVTFRDEPEPEALPEPQWKRNVGIAAAVLVALIVGWIFARGPVGEWSENRLSDQQQSVTMLAGAAAGLSVAISAIPGDAGTPIADQLAGLSGYFVVVLAAVFFQKIATGVMGDASFFLLLPAAFVLYWVSVRPRWRPWRRVAYRLAIFSVVMFAAIPISVTISNVLTNAHNESLEASAADAEKVKEFAGRVGEASRLVNEAQAHSDDYSGPWWQDVGDWFGNVFGSAKDAVTGIGDKVVEVGNEGAEFLSTTLSKVAVLIVTTCVIPILTIVLFAWVIKILFGYDLHLGSKALRMRGAVSGGLGKVKLRR